MDLTLSLFLLVRVKVKLSFRDFSFSKHGVFSVFSLFSMNPGQQKPCFFNCMMSCSLFFQLHLVSFELASEKQIVGAISLIQKQLLSNSDETYLNKCLYKQLFGLFYKNRFHSVVHPFYFSNLSDWLKKVILTWKFIECDQGLECCCVSFMLSTFVRDFVQELHLLSQRHEKLV